MQGIEEEGVKSGVRVVAALLRQDASVELFPIISGTLSRSHGTGSHPKHESGTQATFVASYAMTWPTTMVTALIFLSKRMHRMDECRNQQKWGRSEPFRWSVVFITVTPDEPPDNLLCQSESPWRF